MSTPGAQAGLKTFDALQIEYEKAYGNNPYKKACIEKAISYLKPGSRVLDIGCGTGIPTSQMLANAGMDVVGTDISRKMIALAQSRVKGSFAVADMLTYEPQGTFAAVFMIFCTLQLSYQDFHAALFKFAQAVEPGGILVFGEMPADSYVEEGEWADASETWVDETLAPFFGEMIPTMMMSRQCLLDFLTSMGLEILSEEVDTFQPDHRKCLPEVQHYVIARRVDKSTLSRPRPAPRSGSLGHQRF